MDTASEGKILCTGNIYNDAIKAGGKVQLLDGKGSLVKEIDQYKGIETNVEIGLHFSEATDNHVEIKPPPSFEGKREEWNPQTNCL